MRVDPDLQPLIEMARVGQRAGIEGLYQRFSGLIFSFVSAMLDNQEQALRAMEWTFLQSLRAREDIRDASELPAWMFGIAMTKCREFITDAPSQRVNRADLSSQERLNLLEPPVRAAALLAASGFEPAEIETIVGSKVTASETNVQIAREVPRRSPPLSIWAALDRTLTAQRAMRTPAVAAAPASSNMAGMIVLVAAVAAFFVIFMIFFARRVR